jgi:photosystem II stability/assembly factor-like uncharacterized protein
MMRWVAGAVLAWVGAVGVAGAQWTLQVSHTTADLRGIANVGGGVAWASGSHGTVLRTVDGGKNWLACGVPLGAEKLDFRGVQAFDAKTAVVMSSGTGDLSRLYKTTDGCGSWTLVFTNPDKDGFWDAIHASSLQDILLLGDPVDGQFVVLWTDDIGKSWHTESTAAVLKGEGVFAASNSSMMYDDTDGPSMFGTGGVNGARLFVEGAEPCKQGAKCAVWTAESLPMFASGAGAGIFSVATNGRVFVAVGGDYMKPAEATGTAAFSVDSVSAWRASETVPHGYRSAVTCDGKSKAWIAVGPNGTDVSFDDGRNWRALRPDVGAGDAPDADREWNALSLPFVVGPKGRVGVLREGAVGGGR